MKGSKKEQAGNGVSHDDKDYEKSAKLCARLERDPREYLDRYVGIIRGRIVAVDGNFEAVVRRLQRLEPDRRHHFVVLAGHPQPAEIFNFGLV